MGRMMFSRPQVEGFKGMEMLFFICFVVSFLVLRHIEKHR